MFIFILLLGICQNYAASLNQTFEGSVDELGICHCSVVLPDSTFPVDRFEMLEISNRNLSITVEKEITKIQHYESTLIIYMERLINLTKRVEVIESGGLSYTELDFELLKLEIREMEALILQLKASMTSTNVVVETLYMEIRNISILVNQLEVYDKNNVLVIKREIAALKKRLEDCEKNQTKPTPSPPVEFGTCQHGHIIKISKPVVVQLNYMGSTYKPGGWGRDSMAGADQSVQWVAPLTSGSRIISILCTYNTDNDLLIHKPALERTIASGQQGQGGGIIMFNRTIYYNCYNSRSICKYNPNSNKVDLSVNLNNAVYNNRYSYSSSTYQDFDMAGDEEGLWVIYSTEENVGNIVISKLDPMSLVVTQTWNTGQHKPAATNAFMACGVLYATRSISAQKEEIFYMYDTKTKKEGWLSVPLEKPKDYVHSLSYNPNDHKLYMYNDAFLVTYDLTFKPLQEDNSQI